MLHHRSLLCLVALALAAVPALAADQAGDIPGYTDTPIQPWSGFHVHDPNRPYPKKVAGVATTLAPPADAVVLFDGKNLDQWQKTDWKLVDGTVETTNGGLVSKQSFGNCQIHLEYMGPADFKGDWGNRGNNGVLLMGQIEIQIFDCWNEKIYPDGMAGAIYGQTPPLVNACRPPGEWQSYDIAFTAPVWEGDKLVKAPRVTILHNGVLVQNNQEIYGATTHRSVPPLQPGVSKGPLAFSGHGCPVRFRNVWVRPL